MKRVLFTAMLLIGLCLSASAQKEALYLFSVEGMNFEMRLTVPRKCSISTQTPTKVP